MKLLLILPILIPLTTAAFCLLSWQHRNVQRLLGALGSAAHLLVALLLLWSVRQDGIFAIQVGNWPAPFGITLVADLFSAIMTVLGALMGFTVVIYSLASMDSGRESSGYYVFFHFLLMGVSGVFLTGDLFNLYVWFEVMLMSSFVLLALGGEKHQLEGAIKYVTLNLVSSALFLTALGILYGMLGTLNMADLSVQISDGKHAGVVSTLSMLFLVAFGIKSALFPLFFWLPASYHTPPVAVSAIFAGLLTKVGVYTLIRVFSLLFAMDIAYTHNIILVIAGLTMVTGVLGAMAQNEFRRILSFHIISQVGYMVMGLGLFTPLALAGSIFYIMHHIIVKTNLFLVSGVARRLQGSYQLDRLGGLYQTAPALTIIFSISAFSLAGIPPLSGFWAKLILVKASLDMTGYIIAATALGVGLFTLFSMAKIWAAAFWGTPPQTTVTAQESAYLNLNTSQKFALYLPMIVLGTLTLIIGLMSQPFFELATRAAEQLMNPAGYIEAVLGGK
ncbi:MAG: Na+/H+ antiporter subunit D [Desulfobacterales bacterium]|jgi:multicomponent Na+:H+ antiporter subunit D|nr:Na+/H+ antiporter subunit D [Deltaproteobacteria bacterium]